MNEITELQGTTGYAISALCCLYTTIKVWTLRSNQNSRWMWFGASLISILAAFEIQLSLRFLIKPYLVELLLFFTDYAQRRTAQTALVILLFASLIIWVFKSIMVYSITNNLKVAIIGSAMSVLVFGLALISLHSVDAIFYAPLFHVYTVCWFWNVCAIFMTLGACIEAKQAGNTHR